MKHRSNQDGQYILINYDELVRLIHGKRRDAYLEGHNDGQRAEALRQRYEAQAHLGPK